MAWCWGMGWSFADAQDGNKRHCSPGVGRGKGRGFTKPPLRKRRKSNGE